MLLQCTSALSCSIIFCFSCFLVCLPVMLTRISLVLRRLHTSKHATWVHFNVVCFSLSPHIFQAKIKIAAVKAAVTGFWAACAFSKSHKLLLARQWVTQMQVWMLDAESWLRVTRLVDKLPLLTFCSRFHTRRGQRTFQVESARPWKHFCPCVARAQIIYYFLQCVFVWYCDTHARQSEGESQRKKVTWVRSGLAFLSSCFSPPTFCSPDAELMRWLKGFNDKFSLARSN